MFSAKFPKRTRSLALRLTLWYGGGLVTASVLCLVTFYALFITLSNQRTDASLMVEAEECARNFKEEGMAGVQREILAEAKATGIDDVFIRVLRRDGTVVETSDISRWGDARLSTHAVPQGALSKPVFESWGGLKRHKKARVLYVDLAPEAVLQIGESMQAEAQLVEASRTVLGVGITLVVVLAVLVGWWMARRALAGVHGLTRTAQRIADGRFDARVPLTGRGDEIDRLAGTFNRMAQRIEALVGGMRETNDNIAHELRSPITRIRGLAEMTLTSGEHEPHEMPGGERHDARYEALAADTIEECDRLLGLINTMLDIAEVEAGVASLDRFEVDISQLVRDAVDLFEPVAEEREVTITLEVTEGCLVTGDVHKLQRAVGNVLDNAVKYTPSGGSITVGVAPRGEEVAITFYNTGPGIAKADLPYIFERFYRSKESRARPGNGLGLSLTKAILEALKGTARAENHPEGGCLITLTLPSYAILNGPPIVARQRI